MEADLSAVAQVNLMMRGAVAENTASSNSVIRKICKSCDKKGIAYLHFDKTAVLNFVKEQFGAMFSMALAFLEKVFARQPCH